MKDLFSNMKVTQVLAPVNATVANSSSTIDREGFEEVHILVGVGVIAGSSKAVTPKLVESDDNSTYSDVAETDVDTPFVGIETGVAQKIRYRGNKQFLKVKTVHASSSDKAFISVTALLSGARSLPVS